MGAAYEFSTEIFVRVCCAAVAYPTVAEGGTAAGDGERGA